MKKHAPSHVPTSLKPLGLALLLAASGPALAVDTGTIVTGTGSIAHNGTTTQISQSSDKLIVNWGNFSIANGEAVNIKQPGARSAILNRVTGNQGATQIDGALNANGRVFIVNPNGVVFGNAASVNVGSLVASSLDVNDDQFLQGGGNLYAPDNAVTLVGGRSAPGAVVNNGRLNATEHVYLVGPEVTNRGHIQANGQAGLVGSTSSSIGLDDGRIYGGAPQSNGPAQRTRVDNSGDIRSGSGISLLAFADDLALGSAINSSGDIHGGDVTIRATGGKVDIDGGIDGSIIQVAADNPDNQLGTLTIGSNANIAGSTYVGLSSYRDVVVNGSLASLGNYLDVGSQAGNVIFNGQAQAAEVYLTARKALNVGSSAIIRANRGIYLTSETSRVTNDGNLSAPKIAVKEYPY